MNHTKQSQTLLIFLMADNVICSVIGKGKYTLALLAPATNLTLDSSVPMWYIQSL